MRFADNAESKKSFGVYVFLILALAAGAAAGSVYLSRGWNDMGGGITDYLARFFASAKENVHSMSVVKTSLVSNLITLAVIFVMGFFRFGFIGTGAVIIRRGFITGFTSASFIKAYGMRGILIMLSTMPSSLITAAATLIFSAASIGFSMNENKFQKKFIFSYIFFAVFMVSIFCAASLSEGFLTTTFMKLLAPKIS